MPSSLTLGCPREVTDTGVLGTLPRHSQDLSPLHCLSQAGLAVSQPPVRTHWGIFAAMWWSWIKQQLQARWARETSEHVAIPIPKARGNQSRQAWSAQAEQLPLLEGCSAWPRINISPRHLGEGSLCLKIVSLPKFFNIMGQFLINLF